MSLPFSPFQFKIIIFSLFRLRLWCQLENLDGGRPGWCLEVRVQVGEWDRMDNKQGVRSFEKRGLNSMSAFVRHVHDATWAAQPMHALYKRL